MSKLESFLALAKLYLIALSIFLTIDAVWLGLIAKNFYARHMGFLMAPNINWGVALLAYVIFIAGLVVFAIKPAVLENSFKQAFLCGAFFGFVTYATYDFTNLATIRNWSLLLTIVDLAWGTFLAGAVSALTYFISGRSL